MKILQINTVYKNGGSTGRIVYDLSNCIKGHGSESFVAFGYEYSKTTDRNTFKMENIPTLKLSILKTRLFARHGFYNRRETKRLLKWIEEIRPDIIHLHNLHNHYINIELLFDYIKKHNIPVVWTLHDCWSFTGWCAHFDYVKCNKWITTCSSCPNIKEYPYTWFFDRSFKNYQSKKKVFTGVKNLVIVTPSQWLANLVKQSYLKDYPIKVINNGINLEIFKPQKSNLRKLYNLEDKKIVLALADQFSKKKGIDFLLKLPEKLPDNYVLVLVGLTSKQKKLLPSKCIGVLRTNNVTELAQIYSTADVFVNPTLEDTFPTTNLEAIACGTPVVTFNTGGSPETIKGKYGIIVEKGNFNELVKAVINICNHDKKMKTICVDSAKAYFRNEDSFEKYINIYTKMYECSQNEC